MRSGCRAAPVVQRWFDQAGSVRRSDTWDRPPQEEGAELVARWAAHSSSTGTVDRLIQLLEQGDEPRVLIVEHLLDSSGRRVMTRSGPAEPFELQSDSLLDLTLDLERARRDQGAGLRAGHRSPTVAGLRRQRRARQRRRAPSGALLVPVGRGPAAVDDHVARVGSGWGGARSGPVDADPPAGPVGSPVADRALRRGNPEHSLRPGRWCPADGDRRRQHRALRLRTGPAGCCCTCGPRGEERPATATTWPGASASA